ncbi:MAG: choice-of-anchor J domain-containing protein [Flavobacteriales bacterium]|nr:choice-of-anchor J domain-containing protein [Flavobacteriales bacterium]
MNRQLAFPFFAAALFLVACEKPIDSPPRRSLPVGAVLTVAELRALYTTDPVYFDSAKSVYAVVTADEESGNLYKNVYVQDHTGGIVLRLVNSGGLYQGDSIRIYLPGTKLNSYQGLMQLDSVDVDNNVVKQAVGIVKQPELITVAQVTPAMQGKLVRLEGVEFLASDIGGTYANAITQQTMNRTLSDCAANVLVRTSGYANFAGQQLPTGNGSFVGVVGQFNSEMQLFIRNINEVQLNGPRCSGVLPIMQKTFNDGSVTSGGWTTWTDNNIPWTTNTVGSSDGTAYGQCRNFINSANVPGEAWLISPAVELSSATNPGLSFITACNYNGAQLQVLVSTDYSSGAPSTGTWTALSPALSSGSWAWVQSGVLSLTNHLTSNVRIGFKYTGSSSDGKTWELDNIRIAEP